MLVILWQILEDHNAELFCARRCKKFRKLGKVGSFWRLSLLCITVRAKILSDYAWTSATSKHATFLEIVRTIGTIINHVPFLSFVLSECNWLIFLLFLVCQ